jgi:hypothetical protein
MSVSVNGSVTIKKYRAKRGYFSVGDLTCDLGTFTLKCTALDQFNAGLYQGQFVISSITMQSRPWRGVMLTSIVAEVSDFNLTNVREEEGDSNESASESQVMLDKEEALDQPPSQHEENNSNTSFEAMLKDVFSDGDELYQNYLNKQPIHFNFDGGLVGEKRVVFDKIKQILRETYRFNPRDQHWYLAYEPKKTQ